METKRHCIKAYGFTSDPEKPLWKNIPSALQSLSTQLFIRSPTNLQCHNLCEALIPPAGYNLLLGLGLNFCIEQYTPSPNINNTMERLERSIRLKHWLKENDIQGDDEYIPSLYLPSRWNPPEASKEIEDAINQFKSEITNAVVKNKSHPRTNLTRLQYHCLKTVKDDHRFIICMSDKNLGPVIMERATYLKKCFEEHLLCPRTYLHLPQEEATEKLHSTRCLLNYVRLQYRTDLTEAENQYFQ